MNQTIFSAKNIKIYFIQKAEILLKKKKKSFFD
jgi:hypothetical protein